MPIYEYECPECGDVVEIYSAYVNDVDIPFHRHNNEVFNFKKIPSRQGGHKLTGDDERKRIGRKICDRNNEYWSSKNGVEQIQYDKSGSPDLTKLADK